MTGLVAVGNDLAPFRPPRDRDFTGYKGMGQAAFPTDHLATAAIQLSDGEIASLRSQ